MSIAISAGSKIIVWVWFNAVRIIVNMCHSPATCLGERKMPIGSASIRLPNKCARSTCTKHLRRERMRLVTLREHIHFWSVIQLLLKIIVCFFPASIFHRGHEELVWERVRSAKWLV